MCFQTTQKCITVAHLERPVGRALLDLVEINSGFAQFDPGALQGMGRQNMQSMKTMKLYNKVERILTELHALGIDDDAPLSVDDLTPFDQYHYFGTEAVDHAASSINIRAQSRVLEVGSGIGGPARYLSDSTGCHVTALELQSDLNDTARHLTQRCGLENRIAHVCGNVLDGGQDGQGFDALVSFLCFLHIPDRETLLTKCFAALKPGGRIFIEDFTKLTEPSADEWDILRQKVLCSYLPRQEEYEQQLQAAGFENIIAEDVSTAWTAFTRERHDAWNARRERNLELHGPEITDGMEDFYKTAADLYGSGVLGGVRISAVHP